MTRLSQIGMIVALLLLAIANPTMACLQPGASLSPAEQACCKQMGPMCASSGMAARHSCCQTTVDSSATLVAAVDTSSLVALDFALTAIGEQPLAFLFSPLATRTSFTSPSPPPPSLSSLQTFRI